VYSESNVEEAGGKSVSGCLNFEQNELIDQVGVDGSDFEFMDLRNVFLGHKKAVLTVKNGSDADV